MGFKNNDENNNSKRHKALHETHDMSVQSGPYKLGHSDAHETLPISPWPVPELTGAQWVEPLPQAGYIDDMTTDIFTKALLWWKVLCHTLGLGLHCASGGVLEIGGG